MPRDLPPIYVLHRTFADIDDLAAEALQWDLDFRQLDRSRFRGEVLQFASGGIHISDARFHSALNQKGAPPSGMRTVAVPARNNLRFEWRGKLVDGQSLMLFPLGSELSSVSGPDFHVYTCSFAGGSLSTVAEAFGVGCIDDLTGGAEAIRVDRKMMGRLRRCLSEICQTVRMRAGCLSGAATLKSLTQELPRRLVAAIAARQGQCPLAACPNRQIALTRAEAFIDANASYGIKIGDVCQASGVSERTLQYAFQERFGMGPKEFLHIVRLGEVRRELRAADPRKMKVVDVANAWGFWHMGQFAADYRRRFHELPSETLRGRPRAK